MSVNTVVKRIRKCLEKVKKDTLLNLYYYTTVKQIIFKNFNNTCGCIVGETLNGNPIFIGLDGIYHISVAEHSLPLPSTNKMKKKVASGNSLSKLKTSSIKKSNTQSSEESRYEEKILTKDKLNFDVNEETKAKSNRVNSPKTPRNINLEENSNSKENNCLIKNLQISNINGNSLIVDSGNFNKRN